MLVGLEGEAFGLCEHTFVCAPGDILAPAGELGEALHFRELHR